MLENSSTTTVPESPSSATGSEEAGSYFSRNSVSHFSTSTNPSSPNSSRNSDTIDGDALWSKPPTTKSLDSTNSPLEACDSIAEKDFAEDPISKPASPSRRGFVFSEDDRTVALLMIQHQLARMEQPKMQSQRYERRASSAIAPMKLPSMQQADSGRAEGTPTPSSARTKLIRTKKGSITIKRVVSSKQIWDGLFEDPRSAPKPMVRSPSVRQQRKSSRDGKQSMFGRVGSWLSDDAVAE